MAAWSTSNIFVRTLEARPGFSGSVRQRIDRGSPLSLSGDLFVCPVEPAHERFCKRGSNLPNNSLEGFTRRTI